MKRKKELREIVRAKADFLIYMRIEIAQRLGRAQTLRVEASNLPTGRKADRENAARLRLEAEKIIAQLALDLGGSVIATFGFVKDLQHNLTKKQKQELLK